jgi:hypothetical protein
VPEEGRERQHPTAAAAVTAVMTWTYSVV